MPLHHMKQLVGCNGSGQQLHIYQEDGPLVQEHGRALVPEHAASYWPEMEVCEQLNQQDQQASEQMMCQGLEASLSKHVQHLMMAFSHS